MSDPQPRVSFSPLTAVALLAIVGVAGAVIGSSFGPRPTPAAPDTSADRLAAIERQLVQLAEREPASATGPRPTSAQPTDANQVDRRLDSIDHAVERLQQAIDERAAQPSAPSSSAPPTDPSAAPLTRQDLQRLLDERDNRRQQQWQQQNNQRVQGQWRDRTDAQLAELVDRLQLDAAQEEAVAGILDRTLENFTRLRDEGMEAQRRGESFDWGVMQRERERYLDEIRTQLDATQLQAFETLLAEQAEADRQPQPGAGSANGWNGGSGTNGWGGGGGWGGSGGNSESPADESE